MKAIFLALGVVLTTLPAAASNMSLMPLQQDPGSSGAEGVSERLFQLLDPGSAVLDAACCKTCRKGLARGDSCISRLETCTMEPGCACQAPGT